jgi:hypothetical protein
MTGLNFSIVLRAPLIMSKSLPSASIFMQSILSIALACFVVACAPGESFCRYAVGVNNPDRSLHCSNEHIDRLQSSGHFNDNIQISWRPSPI